MLCIFSGCFELQVFCHSYHVRVRRALRIKRNRQDGVRFVWVIVGVGGRRRRRRSWYRRGTCPPPNGKIKQDYHLIALALGYKYSNKGTWKKNFYKKRSEYMVYCEVRSLFSLPYSIYYICIHIIICFKQLTISTKCNILSRYTSFSCIYCIWKLFRHQQ